MTGEELRQLFESIGPLHSSKLITCKQTQQSLGYGFVNYKSQTDAEKAVHTLNGIRIENKVIKVSPARPSSNTIKGANLYVCGLPRYWTVDDLGAYFGQCGQTITSRVLVDPATGQSKGVGFVRYDQRCEAELAVQTLNGSIPTGCTEPLVVKFASHLISEPMENANEKQPRYSSNFDRTSAKLLASLTSPVPGYRSELIASSFNGGGDSCFPILPSLQLHSPLANNLAVVSSRSNFTPVPASWCLFVYNLSAETEESTLWRLFGPFGAVQNVSVARNNDSLACKGFAFVTMSVYEEALGAIAALNGFSLGGRVLQVSFKND
jgi:ELAV like protein 2/3/4